MAKKADGYSKGTLEKYETGLRDLTGFAQISGYPDDLFRLEKWHIQFWLAALRDRTNRRNHARLSPNTQWSYWMSVKMFYKWAKKERYIKKEPCAGIAGPKPEERVIKPLSKEQTEALLQLCPPSTWWGARDRAIIVLLLTTGIRRQELTGLKLQDLDFDKFLLKVAGKGDKHYQRKERTVALLPQAISALFNWLRHRERIRQQSGITFDSLFLAHSLTGGQWSPLTNEAVGRMLLRLRKMAGIPGVRAHVFRHTFACNYNRSKMTKRDLQEILGHRDPRSTEVYCRYVEHEEALEEQRNLNPFKGWRL